MSSPDDLPALEAEPLLFSLTHLAAAAASSSSGGGGGSRGGGSKGRKRARDSDESEESDFSHASDTDDDEDGGDLPVPDASYAFGGSASGGGANGGGGLMSSGGSALRPERKVKEKDIDGVARPLFPVVQTIHGTAWLGREIDVRTVARRSINAVFCPPSCVRLTIREPVGVAMVYTSGKYVCMGGKSTIDMLTIARKVARKVQRIPEYSNVGFHNFSINNISAHGAFGYRVNLRALSEDPAFGDYTEYEPEQWKGLHYRLPVDPQKTLADLLPSYAAMVAARHRGGEQFSTDEFLQQGEHSLVGTGNKLSYYATTGTAGGRAPKAAAGSKLPPLRLPPSLHGQILTATIYSNGRLTLTGVRREKDIHDAFLRLFHILRSFATTVPPDHPPAQPPYPRIFMPGQRRLIKQEQRAEEAEAAYAAGVLAPYSAASTAHVAAPLAPAAASAAYAPLRAQQPVWGTFAVKTEPGLAPAVPPAVAPNGSASAAPPYVKTEPGTVGAAAPSNGLVKTEPGPLLPGGEDLQNAIVLDGLPDETHTDTAHDDVEWE